VLLGEASHGTSDNYTWRDRISRRLITEMGFRFIAVEGDWPDCYAINQYVKGYNKGEETAVDVLKRFKRWPTWMWANWEIAALMEWLREHNSHLPQKERVGFYGLDVYSLWESMELLVDYLKKEDPKAAAYAVEAMECFEPYQEGSEYARATIQISEHCTHEVLELLQSVRNRAHNYNHDPEAALNAEMNAQIIVNAEEYYRVMMSFNDTSWNIRDRHMADTLRAIHKSHGRNSRGIVWEHNTHVGDARYTDMKRAGLWNVGQLVREQASKAGDVFVVGFSSYAGTVVAGRRWGAPMEIMEVPAAKAESIETWLHQKVGDNALLLMNDLKWKEQLPQRIGHRAIGVVYQPNHEHHNYVPSDMTNRYDALIYLENTKALHPIFSDPDDNRIPETYPFGF